MEGPVLEDFIPIKKRASLDCDEEEDDDDEDEQHLYKPKISKDNNKKSDWLRSVQLWYPDPPTEEKMSVIEVKRSGSGGAFQPFHKEEKKAGKTSESFSKAPSSTPVAAASSTVVTVARDNSGSSKREEKDGQRKQRQCWSQELHKSTSCRPFSSVVVQIATATPKQIREQMKVDGLTNDEIKSHLQ